MLRLATNVLFSLFVDFDLLLEEYTELFAIIPGAHLSAKQKPLRIPTPTKHGVRSCAVKTGFSRRLLEVSHREYIYVLRSCEYITTNVYVGSRSRPGILPLVCLILFKDGQV